MVSCSERIEKDGALALSLPDWSNPLDTVIALARDNPKDARFVYRELLRETPECLRFARRPLKTIALHYRRLRSGGAERVVAELCGRLARLEKDGVAKYRVILLTDEEPSEDDYSVPDIVTRVQIPGFVSGLKGDYEPRARAIWNILDQYAIDVFIDSMWNSRAIPWDLLCVKSHPSHPAYVVHCHGSAAMLYKFDYRPEDTFGPNALADGVVCLSSGDEWYWRQVNRRVRVIANPIVGRPSETVRARGDGKTLLWVGRISREKHPEEALRIFRRVHDVDSSTRLLIVGDVDNPRLKQEMRDYIARYELQDCVSFEGYTPDASSYYQKADLLLVTSEFEGFCLVLYEAAAYGLPIVMYDMPYLMFCERMEGWVSAPQNDATMAADQAFGILHNGDMWVEQSQKLFDSATRFANVDPVFEWDSFLGSISEDEKDELLSNSAFWTLCHVARFHSECSSDFLRQCIVKEEKIEKMRLSHSFRIGKAVTAPLRALKRLRVSK